MYLHYIHIKKHWYYWFDDSDSDKVYKPYNGDGVINSQYTWFAGRIPKSKAKMLLQEKFPDYIPIHTHPYHEGSRIGKCGSRPVKE